MIEICLLESGRQNYIVEGQEYSLTGGDVFLTHPHEKHSTGLFPEEKGMLYWMLIYIPKARQRFLCMPPAQSRYLVEQLLQSRPRHFKGNAKLKEPLRQVFKVFNNNSDPLRIVNLQNLLLRFLLDLLACANQNREQGPSPEIQRVLSFIEQHLCEMISLSVLAEEINLSLSRFKMRFKKEIGIPPSQYIMQQKIEKAKALLSSGKYSVTDVAMQLGFSSSQYFSTVFRQYTRQRPSRVKNGSDLTIH